jgi:putative tryptophan/tyrosine transport system ATP-binding protein
MRDALSYGNRLIMLHNGRIIIDVQGEEKKGFRDIFNMQHFNAPPFCL